jgi:hydrogenase expression/formation protein HypC
MCLAIPALVTELLPGGEAKVSLDGVTKVVSTMLVPDVAVGDYVVLHVGFALQKISAKDAESTLSLMQEAATLAR